MTMVKKEFKAKGTICESCAKTIRRAAMKVDGVSEASFSYASGKGHVIFDDSKASIEQIFKRIEEKGYPCTPIGDIAEVGQPKEADIAKWSGVIVPVSTIAPDAGDAAYLGNNKIAFGLIAFGLLVFAYFMLPAVEGIEMPEFTSTMGYGLIFIAGLLTGFHCISMCGSFVLSYTAKDAQSGARSKRSHLFYGAGKTLSYAIIGGLFGFIGSIIAFTPLMRGAAAIIAGIFLVIYGLRMLNVHPIFRKFAIKTPKSLAKFVHKEEKEHSNPLFIGLLNGLMIACGPLQAMYIMAAGTGNPLQGVAMLLVFGLGTLPAMLGFGYFASAISGKMTHKILKVSGVVVMILGIFMLNNGLALTGSEYDFASISTGLAAGTGLPVVSGSAISVGGIQKIHMNVTGYGYSPGTFVLKKGVPVKWIINAKELNGCNSGILSPKLGLKFQLKQGEQEIDFTPNEEGTIPFTCWMGMIQGRFIVKADVDVNNSTAVQQVVSAAPTQPAGGMTCGGSGGGCGCGVAQLPAIH